MTERIREFLRNRREDGPCLVVDIDVVRDNYMKFARALPNTRVFYAVKAFCRILCDCVGAEWPLSRKFGCVPEMAVGVLEHAHRLGLEAYGVSFHVGSQQRDTESWDVALAQAAWVFRACAERGIRLS